MLILNKIAWLLCLGYAGGPAGRAGTRRAVKILIIDLTGGLAIGLYEV